MNPSSFVANAKRDVTRLLRRIRKHDADAVAWFLENQPFGTLFNGRELASFVKRRHVLEALARDLGYADWNHLATAGRAGAVTTGYGNLDRLLGGVRPGAYMILGSQPGTGKTLFSYNLLLSMAERGIPVGLMTLERGRKQVERILVSLLSGVSEAGIRADDLDAEEKSLVGQAKTRLDGLPIHIDDRYLSLADMDDAFASMTAKGVRLVIVDHCHLVRSDHDWDTSRSLAQAAKGHQVACLGLTQVSRLAQMRPDKRPRRDDIGGAYECDADIVIMAHSDRLYDREAPPVLSLYTTKHREKDLGEARFVRTGRRLSEEPAETDGAE